MSSIEKLKKITREISLLNSAVATLAWDQRTKMPVKGSDNRAETLGLLSTMAFKKSISDEVGDYLEDLQENSNFEELSENDQALVKVMAHDYKKSKSIPPDLFQKYVVARSKSETTWEQAKAKNDFKLFQPHLEGLLEIVREFSELYGYKDNPYDALLDEYEQDLTTEKLKKIIGDLKTRLIPFIRKLAAEGDIPDTSILNGSFDIQKQEKISMEALKAIGYDLGAGRLDETVHPFTIGIGPGDVRITTKYIPDEFTSALFSTIHEGGHALYEQGISEEFKWTPLYSATSLGIHESQSRMMENMIGRSWEFLKFFYPKIQKAFPENFKSVSLDKFYRAINNVEPSLIRTEADEVTYNLHIMLRFELEEAMLNKRLEVKDLPEAWNEKVNEYLGIKPANYSQGVLQDVHWAGGMIGYFPSYMLGNLYAAQFFNKAHEELPDLMENIEKGEIATLVTWLRKKIHMQGKKYTPSELILQVTGEELNSEYFMNYIESKYSRIYNL